MNGPSGRSSTLAPPSTSSLLLAGSRARGAGEQSACTSACAGSTQMTVPELYDAGELHGRSCLALAEGQRAAESKAGSRACGGGGGGGGTRVGSPCSALLTPGALVWANRRPDHILTTCAHCRQARGLDLITQTGKKGMCMMLPAPHSSSTQAILSAEHVATA